MLARAVPSDLFLLRKPCRRRYDIGGYGWLSFCAALCAANGVLCRQWTRACRRRKQQRRQRSGKTIAKTWCSGAHCGP